MMPVPATNFFRAIKLIKVGVNLARLLVENLTVGEVDLFDPLKRGTHAVLHVIIANIDKDLQAPWEQLAENESRISLSVFDHSSYCAVSKHERTNLFDVKSCPELIEALWFGKEFIEAIAVNKIFICEMWCVHLFNIADRLCDVVKDVLTSSRLVCDFPAETRGLFTAALECLNLVGLEIVVEAKSPTDGFLIQSFSRGVDQGIR